MNITTTDYNEKLSKYHRVLEQLYALQKDYKMPEGIVDILSKAHQDVASYDMTQYKPILQTLTGHILTEEEVKNIIVEASGYTKWQPVNFKEEYGDDDDGFGFGQDPKNYENVYGVIVETCTAYHFRKNTNSRDEIRSITVDCLPGYVSVSLNTGRVGFGLDGLVPNENFQKQLSEQFD